MLILKIFLWTDRPYTHLLRSFVEGLNTVFKDFVFLGSSWKMCGSIRNSDWPDSTVWTVISSGTMPVFVTLIRWEDDFNNGLQDNINGALSFTRMLVLPTLADRGNVCRIIDFPRDASSKVSSKIIRTPVKLMIDASAAITNRFRENICPVTSEKQYR